MKWYDVISSFFYTGKIKYAPGTFTSLITLIIIYLLILLHLPIIYFILITVILFIFGTIVSNLSEKQSNTIDPGWITIDETTGMFTSLLLMNFYNLKNTQIIVLLIIAFVLFRFLDIYKPFPIRQSQKIKGGLGIMIDDLIGGVIANLLTRLFFYIIFKQII